MNTNNPSLDQRWPYQIGDFGHVDHRVDIVATLDEGDSTFASCEDTLARLQSSLEVSRT